jgi:hypothetical protein
MEGINHGGIARAQADVDAAVGGDWRHIRAAVDPKLGIFLAVADRGIRPFAQLGHAERDKQRGVEALSRLKIADGNRNVIDHAGIISRRGTGFHQLINDGIHQGLE